MWPRFDATVPSAARHMARMAEAPRVVSAALRTLSEVAAQKDAAWALVGGQALIAHGVPRDTLDADALVDRERIAAVAGALAAAGWTPLRWDDDAQDYVQATAPRPHFFEDPVLFDVSEERVMFPLAAPDGLLVELLAAQHPIETEMVETATPLRLHAVTVPVAVLGGVLLVKTKAHRTKDIGAIEQTAEHLPRKPLEAAIEWARERDPGTADDLASVVAAAKARKRPTRVGPPSGSGR